MGTAAKIATPTLTVWILHQKSGACNEKRWIEIDGSEVEVRIVRRSLRLSIEMELVAGNGCWCLAPQAMGTGVINKK
jgi:hypothetical protein